MAKDVLSLLSKMSAGALDGELNALAEKRGIADPRNQNSSVGWYSS